ncbi:acetyltransferase, gnat family [Streptococcus pneumoniae]|nr:acetyltransferase, gnat family [Streptococcus pneumoniae]
MKAALTALNHFSEIFLWVLKDNKRAMLSIKKWVLLLMDKKRYLNLESL